MLSDSPRRNDPLAANAALMLASRSQRDRERPRGTAPTGQGRRGNRLDRRICISSSRRESFRRLCFPRTALRSAARGQLRLPFPVRNACDEVTVLQKRARDRQARRSLGSLRARVAPPRLAFKPHTGGGGGRHASRPVRLAVGCSPGRGRVAWIQSPSRRPLRARAGAAGRRSGLRPTGRARHRLAGLLTATEAARLHRTAVFVTAAPCTTRRRCTNAFSATTRSALFLQRPFLVAASVRRGSVATRDAAAVVPRRSSSRRPPLLAWQIGRLARRASAVDRHLSLRQRDFSSRGSTGSAPDIVLLREPSGRGRGGHPLALDSCARGNVLAMTATTRRRRLRRLLERHRETGVPRSDRRPPASQFGRVDLTRHDVVTTSKRGATSPHW